MPYLYADCINQLDYQNKIQQYAHQEAEISGIPPLKERILIDRPDWYQLTTDKVKLITQYKIAHNKPLLTEEQIEQIIKIENEKQKFKNNNEVCK